jgi:excisionase family DNA binding protein
MAGMFCSKKEAAEKLNVSEDKIEDLVQKGRLRQFPGEGPGSEVLFKIDDVEALLSDPSLALEVQKENAEIPEAEPVEELGPADLDTGTDISLELEADDTVTAESPPTEPSEQELPAEETKQPAIETPAEETKQPAIETPAEETKQTPLEATAGESEIFLASTSADSELAGDLTSGDTALTQEGVNVLGETDSQYQLIEDTKGETQDLSAEEPSLEQIEEDVNLDSFGSGSGLLDLSLQADDTSLGGILDDIYMSEGEDGQEAAPIEGSEMDMAAEADSLISDQEPEAVPLIPGAIPSFAEPPADTKTTVLVLTTLMVSLAVAIYTAIVVLRTSVGSKIFGFWLYAFVGVLALAVVCGAASLATGGGPKTKKPKKPKVKKEKKKKEKPPKKEKKKKEKKKKEKKKKKK